MKVTLKQAHALACEDPDLIYMELSRISDTCVWVEAVAIAPGGTFICEHDSFSVDDKTANSWMRERLKNRIGCQIQLAV